MTFAISQNTRIILSDQTAFSPTSHHSAETNHGPIYQDQEESYPYAGTWNKVRDFLESNIQLFQGLGLKKGRRFNF